MFSLKLEFEKFIKQKSLREIEGFPLVGAEGFEPPTPSV